MGRRAVDVQRLLQALGIRGTRRGSEVWAPCPSIDHHEARPSWSILDRPGSPKHGVHSCFGCKWDGDAVDLVVGCVGLSSRRAAVAWMEDHDVLEARGCKGLARPVMVRVPGLEAASAALQVPRGVEGWGELESWPTAARRYARRRGIAGAVEDWGIGAAAFGRLAGRIVIPFREEGRIVSYSARLYRRDPREPRYKMPRRQDGGRVDAIFGIDRWVDRSTVVVLEGAIDAIACGIVGARQVAALAGSSVTAWQMRQLMDFDRVVVLTDADLAGSKVARVLSVLRRWGCNVVRLEIAMDDPAGLLERGEGGQLRSLLSSGGVTLM